jgi:hypothetical protein
MHILGWHLHSQDNYRPAQEHCVSSVRFFIRAGDADAKGGVAQSVHCRRSSTFRGGLVEFWMRKALQEAVTTIEQGIDSMIAQQGAFG